MHSETIQTNMKLTFGKFLLLLFIALKVKWILNAIFYRDKQVTSVKSLKSDYTDFLNGKNLSGFNLMERKNLTYLNLPYKDCTSSKMISVVLTSPNNFQRREKLRREIENNYIEGKVIQNQMEILLKF